MWRSSRSPEGLRNAKLTFIHLLPFTPHIFVRGDWPHRDIEETGAQVVSEPCSTSQSYQRAESGLELRSVWL